MSGPTGDPGNGSPGGRESARLRARAALIDAADALFDTHDYAGADRTLRLALDLDRDGAAGDWPWRFPVIDRLARCAEMRSERSTAIDLLCELADGHRATGDLPGLAAAQRRLATVHELGGDWAAALAARETAAAAFRRAGRAGDAAADRLAIAVHLRGAARYSAALLALDKVLPDARAGDRADLVLRAEGLRGNVLARLGRPGEGVPAVRAALDAALSRRDLDTAAELQQRLADSLEHGGDYDGAATAYRAAYLYCDTHGADATGRLCRACATAVLFNRGEWDLAVDVCRDVLAEPGTAAQPRAVSSCLLGLIHALRGEAAKARPPLTEAAGLSARIELVAVELLSAWGLAVLEAQSGAVTAATDRIRQALARLGETQERHYCLPFLQWAATFLTGHGLADDALACAAALSSICEATGQAEAVAVLAHVLGETKLAGDPAGAAGELRRAAAMFGELELPFAAAHAGQRAAAALRVTGDARGARKMLLTATAAAERLGARPLLGDCETALRELDTAPRARGAAEPAARAGEAGATEPAGRAGSARGTRLADEARGDGTGRRSPGAARALAGLTARELDVMVLVAAGNTSREVGAALFISPRTVEMHVQGCLLKLNCRTRAEAVRKLTELGALSLPTGTDDPLMNGQAPRRVSRRPRTAESMARAVGRFIVYLRRIRWSRMPQRIEHDHGNSDYNGNFSPEPGFLFPPGEKFPRSWSTVRADRRARGSCGAGPGDATHLWPRRHQSHQAALAGRGGAARPGGECRLAWRRWPGATPGGSRRTPRGWRGGLAST